jgi:hypothetical protein
MMDCYGKGKVKKFAEITAAAITAGDLSAAHEKYGRNRPAV